MKYFINDIYKETQGNIYVYIYIYKETQGNIYIYIYIIYKIF
jgi:hypothetical protein